MRNEKGNVASTAIYSFHMMDRIVLWVVLLTSRHSDYAWAMGMARLTGISASAGESRGTTAWSSIF